MVLQNAAVVVGQLAANVESFRDSPVSVVSTGNLAAIDDIRELSEFISKKQEKGIENDELTGDLISRFIELMEDDVHPKTAISIIKYLKLEAKSTCANLADSFDDHFANLTDRRAALRASKLSARTAIASSLLKLQKIRRQLIADQLQPDKELNQVIKELRNRLHSV